MIGCYRFGNFFLGFDAPARVLRCHIHCLSATPFSLPDLVQVDTAGNIIVAGTTKSPLVAPGRSGKSDVFLMSFSSRGTHQWTTQRGGFNGWNKGQALEAWNGKISVKISLRLRPFGGYLCAEWHFRKLQSSSLQFSQPQICLLFVRSMGSLLSLASTSVNQTRSWELR